VSDAVPNTAFEAVAVIVTVPVVTPVATPLAFTVAMALSLLDQVNVVLTGLLLASNAAARKACVAPVMMLAEAGDTMTVAG
jgi:hypothetical protein